MGKTSYTERVLIVLNADGSLRGASQYQLTTLTDDATGAVLMQQQEDAKPVDAATLASVLPAQAGLTAQVSAMTDAATASAALRASIATALGLAGTASDSDIAAGVVAAVAAKAQPAAAPAAAQVPSCALWQLEAALTPAQWQAAQAAVTALGNQTVTAFFQHGTNVIPANSTTLAQLAVAIGIDPATLPAIISQAAAISIP